MSPRYKLFCRCFSSLRGAFVVSLLVFLLLSLIGFGMSWLYGRHIDLRAVRSLQSGIEEDLNRLNIEGDALAHNELLKSYVTTGERDKILTLLNAERERRGIGLLTLTDNKGIVVSRTRTASFGDDLFLVSPQGRSLAAGVAPRSVEVSSFNPAQVVMTTGRSILTATSIIGALFANTLLDDSYAHSFKERHLFDGVQVAFYTKHFGLYGTSFDDDLREMLSSYFNTDSDWIKRGRTGDIVKFSNNSYYRVENITFPGLEKDNLTGALIFVPYLGYALAIRLLGVVITAFIFFILVRRALKATRKEYRNRYYFWSIFTTALALLFAMYMVNHIIFARYVSLKKIPYVLYNSTLRLLPESGVFGFGYERPISILVDTGDESINAFSTHISYDPAIVDIEEIDTSHSICSKYLEKSIDPVAKEVRLTCLVFSPGFSGSQGLIADLVLKPRKLGSVDLIFATSTQVLANDGLGTNVLRRATDGNYRIVSNDLASLKFNGSSTDSHTPIIFSPTHPNPSRWYNSSTVRLYWTSLGADMYRYSFDQATNTIPKDESFTTDTKATVTAPTDGVFYFHVLPIFGSSEGIVRHYKVMIDTTPPADVVINIDQDKASAGDIVRLEFEGRDSMSGLQNTMYVDVNDNVFLPVGRQMYVPLVDIGEVSIKLRVYDNAGNYTEKEKVIDVGGTILQRIMHSR